MKIRIIYRRSDINPARELKRSSLAALRREQSSGETELVARMHRRDLSSVSVGLRVTGRRNTYTYENITQNFRELCGGKKPDCERYTCRASTGLCGVETESQDHPANYEENNESDTSTVAQH